jgi:signal transduction histidine kinase/ligand-binding sensor domain-containing protein/DNA-binding response OmpR family regulator
MYTIKRHAFLELLLWFSVISYSQNHKNFKPITPLINNKPTFVYKTVQDKLGNIWMACANGILIYDGYNYKPVYNNEIFKTNSENVGNIIIANNKEIWITSSKGSLVKYDYKESRFKKLNTLINKQKVKTIYHKNNTIWLATTEGVIYRHTALKTDSITQIFTNNTNIKNIKNLAVTTPNNVIISTENGKIFNYNLKTKNYTEIIGPYTDYPGNIILTTDKNNRLWIGTETYGVFVYDILAKKFIQNELFKNEKYDVNKEMFLTLYNDSDNNIWGGTDGGGLYKINANTGDINLYYKQDANEFSLRSNTILNINEDNHQNLWICTNYGNLSVLPNVDNNINYHEGSANDTPQRILSIFKSSKNILWIGTDGSGITKVNFSPDSNTKETQYFNNISLNKGFYVQSITEDQQANIWFGTYRNGLWYHNTTDDSFKKIRILNTKNQEATDVRTLFKDSKGRIWACSNISINIYDDKQKLLASFENNSRGLSGLITESIVEDQKGTIWLGTFRGGLFKFNENKHKLSSSSFSNISHPKNIDLEFPININSIAIGDLNTLLIIDLEGKIFKFNTKTYTFNFFENIQIFKDISLTSIIKQDDNNFWLSSRNGIFHLNTKTLAIKSYYSTDGLQDNIFLPRSSFKDSNGILYFGGINGLNYFDPKKISKKESTPKLYINTIEILNQPIEKLLPDYSNLSSYNLETLNLKSNQSSFSFKFSVIDNILGPKYYYKYRLKGFNNKWIVSGQERLATYTNIPSGNYIFEVKAGTKKGIWDINPKQIVVNIAPPIWQSKIAYFIYFMLLCLILYALKLWYKLKKKLLLEKLNHKKENELHDLKMHFFAKMSHEIQTPITLILSPLDEMLKQSKKNGNLLLNQQLKIIENNSKRLSKIARELTLVRNKELNELKLLITKNNLCNHINEITLSFKELARKKNIDFIINCPKNLQSAWYDKEKIEHVIYNLLSNAFKFTPKEGNIQINVIPLNTKKQIKVSVSDSGFGIPKEELELIFNLFYQSKSNKKTNGSGIGLALTKELVDLHKGKIEVESSPIQGTVFTFIIAINKEAYTSSELMITDDSDEIINTEFQKETTKNTEITTNDLSKKTILIVEDNYDLQCFLKELLINEYNILLAENGAEGYHYAKNNFPDLILSDIMMPKLDGIEMCLMLQEDSLTKHIPIILLTAKNSTNSKISGLKSGAIEYINKPFNTKELELKIKNIISSKEYIISKYRKEIISSPNINVNKTQNEILLENLTSLINKKLNDKDFKIENLADSLNMSYSSLYRKCQALTGRNLVEYIKLIRLKRAIILITKYGYNVSEAAFMVGFNDAKYFSKCFKKQYKKSPKEFEKEALKIGVDKYLKNNNIELLHSVID